jgi:hypothetical protein
LLKVISASIIDKEKCDRKSVTRKVRQKNPDRKTAAGKTWQKKCGRKIAAGKVLPKNRNRKTAVEKPQQLNLGNIMLEEEKGMVFICVVLNL